MTSCLELISLKRWTCVLTITVAILLVSIGHPQKIFAKDGNTPPDEKAEVMILGTSHFSNPGQDVINTTFPDVLKPKYQRQIARVIDSLSTFKPTKVAIESRESFEAKVDSVYQCYWNGNHELTRNERQQLGFRLGKRFNHSQLYAIDHDGKFPFREVLTYAKSTIPNLSNTSRKPGR